MANDMRSEAARLITELAPGDLNMVFFTNGGAEAIENATRMARLHTERHKVLSTYKSYHGATAGAISHDRRRAALGQRTRRPGCSEVLGAVPVPVGVQRHVARRGMRAGAGRTCAPP